MSPIVCIVTTVHPPRDQRIFHKEARSLAQAGYRVTILAQGAEAGEVDGVRFQPLPPRPRKAWQRWPRLWNVWRRARALRADVYHLHDPELTLVGLMLKLGRRRVIYDVHENVPLQILNKQWIPWAWLRVLTSRLYDLLECFCANRFDGVIAAFENIAERFPNARRVVMVKNLPEVERWLPADAAAGDEVIAVYVGDLTRPRGTLEMVKAVGRLDPALNVHLWVIGGFPHPDYEAEVRAAANERVRFFGRVPHHEVPRLLAQCHIGMLTLHPVPNHLVAWPVKLFEYMAAGLPIVTTDIPLWRRLAAGCAVAVNPLEPDSIARALAELARDPARRAEMGQRGRALVEEHYNWTSQRPHLLALYREIVGAPEGHHERR